MPHYEAKEVLSTSGIIFAQNVSSVDDDLMLDTEKFDDELLHKAEKLMLHRNLKNSSFSDKGTNGHESKLS